MTAHPNWSWWIVLLAVACVLSSVVAQEGRDPREFFLQQARETPSAQWPEHKQRFLTGVRGNLGRVNSDAAAVDRAATAIGQILEEARAMSDADFKSEKGELLDRWGQALIWLREVNAERLLAFGVIISFSPSHGRIDPAGQRP